LAIVFGARLRDDRALLVGGFENNTKKSHSWGCIGFRISEFFAASPGFVWYAAQLWAWKLH